MKKNNALVLTLKQQIINTAQDTQLTKWQAAKNIENIVYAYLDGNGKFSIINEQYHYFSNTKNKMFILDSKDFSRYMSSITGLNQNDKILDNIISSIDTKIFEREREKDMNISLKDFAFFDRKAKELYVYTNSDKMIHIKTTWITVVKNWYNGVTFQENDHEPWEFSSNVKGKQNYIEKLIDSINFDTSMLSKKDLWLILEHYIYSLFFPELLNTKVICIITWDKGAWKTYLLQTIYKIFYGEKRSIITMPPDNHSLEVILASNNIVFIDNVEVNKKSLWGKIDIMCSSATSAWSSSRELYTNGKQFYQDITSNIGLTSIDPEFNRSDLASRALIFYVKERGEYWSASLSQSDYFDNRNTIMSQICFKLKDIVINIQYYKNFQCGFRMADFSNFCFNNLQDDKDRVKEIFSTLTRIQQKFTVNNDLLLTLLEDMFDSGEMSKYADKFFQANEWNKTFSLYSSRPENKNLKYPYNPKNLWRILNNNMASYKNIAGINIIMQKRWWNQRFYCISRIPSESID